MNKTFIVFNEQGIKVFSTTDEIEAQFVSMYENGFYTEKFE